MVFPVAVVGRGEMFMPNEPLAAHPLKGLRVETVLHV
jgi:hypothetical protein